MRTLPQSPTRQHELRHTYVNCTRLGVSRGRAATKRFRPPEAPSKLASPGCCRGTGIRTMTLDDLRRNRNRLFWALHTLGWSAYFFTQYVGALLYEKPAAYIKVLALAALGGFVFSAPLRYIYRALWTRPACHAVPWRGAVGVAHGARLACGDQPRRVAAHARLGHGGRAVVRDLLRHAELDVPAALLVGALFRHQVLRDAAGAARDRTASLGARAGGAAQDAALPAQPAFPVQHAERDLDADPRRPGQDREPGRRPAVGLPALHARPGPDEEGHAARRRSTR